MGLYPDLVLYGKVITSPAEYMDALSKAMSKVRKLPQLAAVNPPVLVQSTALRVRCQCGNYPIAVFEWRLACCLQCGLYYENLEFDLDAPEDAG